MMRNSQALVPKNPNGMVRVSIVGRFSVENQTVINIGAGYDFVHHQGETLRVSIVVVPRCWLNCLGHDHIRREAQGGVK